ncbi:CLUMA_CG010725, isoform A [Clunio marinus]|uniref:CLUMA_CG010725, isoform A n=1 Tax=Clunio marinus TaxID=568069 RepID=A0A1J1ICQ1_9DIPT|nr:CLUMA_CG010725, isoform A [Clunio marinus]
MGKPFNDPENPDSQKQTPSAPPLTDLVNDTSYIDFIILGNKENYSVRADRLSILNSNTELSRLVKAEKFTINQSNVNVSNFEALIRFIETKFIRFNDDIKNTLNILELASTFQCHDLEIACVKELDMKLSVENVIDIFKVLRYYNTKTVLTIRTAPKPSGAEEYLNAMFYNTLQFIDQNAVDVLSQTEMLTLRFEEFEIIIKRDALQIPSETIIFNLLADWSSKECERKIIEPSEENRRRVLGGLIYSPRFLLLSYEDFQKCRDRVSLLDPVEIQLIEDFFNKKKASNLTEEQIVMLQNFKKSRPSFPGMPIHLSNRSNPKNYPKKMRKHAQKLAEEGMERSRCDSCLVTCASIFACIFE